MSNATAIAVPSTSDPLFHLATFLAGYNGETRVLYTIRMRVFVQWCTDQHLDPIHGITRPHLELYARYLEDERHNCRATVNSTLSTLKSFYRLLAIDRVIEYSPAEYVRQPRAFRDEAKLIGLDRADLSKFLFTARRMSPDHAALATLGGMIGLRVSECCNVKVSDFAETERGHRVLRLVGKGGKPATIPLPVAVVRELDRCAEGRGQGRLLRRIDGVTPLDRRSAYRMVAAIARKAEIHQHVTPHTLRRSFVSAMFEAGVNVRDAQIAARHEDPRTTASYDTARRSHDRHAAHIVSAFLSGGA